MEILAYVTCGMYSKNISITYDSALETDRAEADKFVSRIIEDSSLSGLEAEGDVGEMRPD